MSRVSMLSLEGNLQYRYQSVWDSTSDMLNNYWTTEESIQFPPPCIYIGHDPVNSELFMCLSNVSIG